MDTTSEIKSKYFALAATIGLHAILLLLFLWIVFIKPVETANATVLSDDQNYIDISSIQTGDHEADSKMESSVSKSILTVSQNKSVITSNVVDKDETDVSATTRSDQQTENELGEALKKFRAIKKSKETEATNSIGGETESLGNGNEKKGSTTTTSVSTEVLLNGRRLVRTPDAITDSKEEGKVVVAIIVDESGNVMDAVPGQRGSTTTSAFLFEKAKRIVQQAKFNVSADGIKEQRGTYTLVFALQ